MSVPHEYDESIGDLQDRLEIHRSNLRTYLRQQALLGGGHVPPGTANGIREARQAIRRLKHGLRRLGAEVADLPDDPEDAEAPAAEAADRYDLRRRARRAYYERRWAEALPLLEQVLRAEPDNAEYRAFLDDARLHYDEQDRLSDIEYFLAQGDWGAALQAIEDVARRYPLSAAFDTLRRQAEAQRRSAVLRPAQEQIERGMYGAAITWLAQRLQQHPDDRDAAGLLAALIELPGVPLIHRVRAAEVAGYAGDPRLPTARDDWRREVRRLPAAPAHAEGYWCPVSPPAEGGERPPEPSTATFWLARYPLTNSQYRAFVLAGGYGEPRWWSPEGWAWRERRYAAPPTVGPSEVAAGQPNQPLVGLNWYEALAFCAWLEAQIQDLIPPGHQLRPPTETEWETAAAYDQGGRPSRYPWGAGPLSTEHAVYRASATAGPLAVGCCPAGRAACGALDLIGNVWELLVPPEPAEPAIPWRGGCWYSTAEELDRRITMHRATRHVHDGGLRLALGPTLRLP